MNTKTHSKILIISSLLGLLNGSYLTWLFINLTYFSPQTQSFCDINSQITCSSIVTSKYAQLFGLPICTIAAGVYLIMIILAILSHRSSTPKNYFFTIALLSSAGAMMNIIYTHNEWLFLKSICALCLFCLVFILTNLVTSILGYLKADSLE